MQSRAQGRVQVQPEKGRQVSTSITIIIILHILLNGNANCNFLGSLFGRPIFPPFPAFELKGSSYEISKMF